MYLQDIRFPLSPRVDDSADALFGAWRNNGQVLGREFFTVTSSDGIIARVATPLVDSLDARNDGVHAKSYRAGIEAAEEGGLRIRCVGEVRESAAPCSCSRRSSLILYTDYVSLESPVRCGDCFGFVPLYVLPPKPDTDHHDIISWASNYRDCDSLQMGCLVLENAAIAELGGAESALSRQGRALAEAMTQSLGIPVYYYLLRATGSDPDRDSSGGADAAIETARKCPGCDGDWKLDTPLFDRFDFRCDRCRLLSNISFECRPR